MGNKILYTLLFIWVKIHALLPMRILYMFSNVLYFMTYHIIGYRRHVVRNNLQNSFPDKSTGELMRLERQFYRHFADYIVETIKLAGISHSQLMQRAQLHNAQLVKQLTDAGHTCCIMLLGHYGNWEWFTGYQPLLNVEVHQVYRPLKNKAFDNLFLYMRTRFGSQCTPKKDVVRDIVRLKQTKTPSLIVLIADQTPSPANLHYWTTFLNQNTPMLTGAETLAAKFDLPIIFADVKKQGRGRYTVDFQLMTDKPKEMPQYRITEEYTRRMEQSIMRQPAFWLWTHKRWKYKPAETI